MLLTHLILSSHGCYFILFLIILQADSYHPSLTWLNPPNEYSHEYRYRMVIANSTLLFLHFRGVAANAFLEYKHDTSSQYGKLWLALIYFTLSHFCTLDDPAVPNTR